MDIWSWVLSAIGLLGIYLAGSHNRLGWLLGVFAQVLWLSYAVVTQQYGFIVSAFAYGFMYIRNYRLWKSDKKGMEEIQDE